MDADSDKDLLDWVETSALENIKGHIKSADDIKRESNTALALLMAGAGGSLAYSLQFIESPPNIVAISSLCVLSLYLFLLCAILVFKCLMVGEFPSATNEPKHLNQKGYALERLRKVELKNVQVRIESASRINAIRACWLNRVWVGATASPLIFAVAFGLTYFLVPLDQRPF